MRPKMNNKGIVMNQELEETPRAGRSVNALTCATIGALAGTWLMLLSHTGNMEVATQLFAGSIGMAIVPSLISYGACALTKQRAPWVYATVTILIAALMGFGMQTTPTGHVVTSTTAAASQSLPAVHTYDNAPSASAVAAQRGPSTSGVPKTANSTNPPLLPPDAMDQQYQSDHPLLRYGRNSFLFESKMLKIVVEETKSTTGNARVMPYQEMMDKAYADAERDPSWVTP